MSTVGYLWDYRLKCEGRSVKVKQHPPWGGIGWTSHFSLFTSYFLRAVGFCNLPLFFCLKIRFLLDFS